MPIWKLRLMAVGVGSVKSAQSKDTTDAQGRARFPSPAPGRYRVTVSASQCEVEAFAVVRSGVESALEVSR